MPGFAGQGDERVNGISFTMFSGHLFDRDISPPLGKTSNGGEK